MDSNEWKRRLANGTLPFAHVTDRYDVLVARDVLPADVRDVLTPTDLDWIDQQIELIVERSPYDQDNTA